MNWLRKIENRQTPSGMEMRILRRLPVVTLVASLAVLALPVLVRMLPVAAGLDPVKHARSVDIFAIATGITLLVAAFTVAIGCIIVHIMKGPAYAADSFPVSHADRPARKDPE
ncbi:MAG: hypothetical protein P8X98_05325 [Woeseiaceae bacterium]